ncbi:MAG: O-antigen ligase [Candidatus Moranbacteria bacterium]|nr:O-antigen ligase [Candidatus Moranbacteria bacterium]
MKKDKKLLERSLAALFCSGVAVSAVGLAYEISGATTYDGRLAAFWSSPNQLAMYLAVPFLVGVYFAKRETRNEKREFFYSGLILTALALFFTKSYGAWLALGISLLVWLVFELKNKVKIKNVFLVGLIITALLSWAGVSKFQAIQKMGGRSSLASRIMIGKSAGLMAQKNPFFGIGPGNFQEKYLEYQKYFPPYLEWSVPQPHNIFLAFWLESGILGFAGFVWVSFLFFRDNKISIQKDRDLGILFSAVMAYILAHGLVDTTYWRNDLAVVFWAVVFANYYLSNGSPAKSKK